MHKTKIQGFTIVEVLTVVAVIGILATITYVTMSPDRRRNAAADVVKSSLQIVASDLKLQKSMQGEAAVLPDSYDASSEDVRLQLVISTKDEYCLEGTHADYPEVKLYIDSTMTEAVEGSCIPENLADDFNRSGSTLGAVPNTEGSVLWRALSGSWSTNGSKPVLSSSPSNSPLAVVDYGRSDADVKVDLNVNDALYFRVKDANNWWRVRERTNQQCTTYYTETPYYTYEYEYRQDYYCPNPASGYSSSWGGSRTAWGTSFPSSISSAHYAYTYYDYPKFPCYTNGYSGQRVTQSQCPSTGNGAYYEGDQHGHSHYKSGSPYQTGNSRSVYAGTTTTSNTSCTTYYNLVLEKSVNGTITQVWTQAESTTRPTMARVVANGESIAVYSSVSGSALATVNDGFNANETEYGIGRATSSTSGTAMDNFVLTQ